MPLTPDQRELLKKRLRANVSFRKTVRTSGVANAQEVLQRYNQEQREDEKKLMKDMIQEMKGMKRTHSKKFVNSVTNTMTDSQLQTLRQQAGPEIQHLIPTKGDAKDVNPVSVYQPPEEPSGMHRGLSQIAVASPQSLLKPQPEASSDWISDLPAPKRTV